MTREQGTGVSIRNDVAPADVARVGQLVARTGFFNESEIEIAKELVEERLTKGDASDYFFVLLDGPDGELIGYACFGPIACTASSFDLYWIAVDPSHQRGGWGRRLMEWVEKAVQRRGGTRLYIDTSGRSQYCSTRSFYERCGYRCEAILEDFYAPGDSKCIYGKGLQPTDFGG